MPAPAQEAQSSDRHGGAANRRDGHTARIKQLRAPKSEGGFGLPELAAQVVAERRALERVENELTRQQPLKEDRGDRSAMRSGNSRKPGLWPMRC